MANDPLHVVEVRQINETMQIAEARLVSETNINLAAADTPSIDFATTNYGDRVLLVGQTDASENGLWVVRSPDNGGWFRDPLMDGNEDLRFLIWGVRVLEGGQLSGQTYLLTSDGSLSLGRDELVWEKAGAITAGNPIQVSGNHINIPMAHNGSAGLLSAEDWALFNAKVNLGDGNNWPQLQRFQARGTFEVDLAIKGNAGGSSSYGQLAFGTRTNIDDPTDPRWVTNFTGFVLPRVAVNEATVAVLGAEPRMSDGTSGSRFVGKVGFYGATPVGRGSLPAAATDLASAIALVNGIRTLLIDLGLASA